MAPSAADLERAVQDQGALPYSYPCVGATRDGLPEGWTHDDESVLLGSGDAVWARAKTALRQWTQFDLRWVTFGNRSTPLEEGQTVAFASNQLGFWTLNVCRIVYVEDTDTAFGFAYGTLENHVVRGEERFMLHRDPASDEVRFQLSKFSLPSHPVLRLLNPLTVHIQRRFTSDALRRMHAEVA
jgi:uncharacterized protein (UPF0548 family)